MHRDQGVERVLPLFIELATLFLQNSEPRKSTVLART
jgi:hypothetical protein